jgi:hyperosmotically inducible protein
MRRAGRTVIGLGSVLLLGLTGFLTGCTSQDKQDLQEDTKKLAKDTGEALGTAALTAKVRTHLSLHKGVSQSGIEIQATKEGMITVSGHVRDKAEHDRVMNIVKETPGVEKAEDKLNIDPSKEK